MISRRRWSAGARRRLRLRVHPAVPHAVRTVRPEGAPPDGRRTGRPGPRVGWAGADPPAGCALAAGRGRAVATDPAGDALQARPRPGRRKTRSWPAPIADALEPLPDPAALWLALARRVGLVEPDPSGERLLAAPPEFWTDNAVHLPQMIATGWLALADLARAGRRTGRRAETDAGAGRAVSPPCRAALAGHARRRRSGSPSTTWPGTSRRAGRRGIA